MTDLLYRTVTPDLQVRAKGDGRTIIGIAIPYGTPQRIDSHLSEQFARGAFNHQLSAPYRVRYARDHVDYGGELIGAAKMLRDDAAGLYVELRVSKTAKGDETLELVKDGALRQLSVGFRERENRRLPGGVIERVKADLFEVASVLEGAYGELAAVSGVRSAAGGSGGGAGAAVPGDVRVYVDGEEIDAAPFEHLIRTARLEDAKLVLAGLPELPAAAI